MMLAVLDYGDKYLVMTTDLLLEGVHFNLVYAPMRHLGYKAAVVNFSDIFAMNASPRQLLVSIAVSGKFAVEALDEFYAGLRLACKQYQVDLVGGDTSTSLTGFAINITVIGEVEKNKITYRSTARENDLICVTGDLGADLYGIASVGKRKEYFRIRSWESAKIGCLWIYTGTSAKTGSPAGNYSAFGRIQSGANIHD